jgi:hypothetical protein
LKLHAAPLGTRQGRKEWIGIPTDSLEALLSRLKVEPTLYVSEMMEFLCSIGHRVFSSGQIWRALNSRNITRKVLEIHAKEQNEARRQEYLRVTSFYTAEQRFYVDER